MADKSPKKAMTKKPGMSIKEKRAAKKIKRDTGGAPLLGTRPPRTGS